MSTTLDARERYLWNGTDSTFEGVAVSWFQKTTGKHMVVLEDDRGLLHIYPMTGRLVPVHTETARSRAPVREDERIRALLGDPRDSVSVGPEGAVYQRHDAPAPPAKDTGEGEAGASVIHETISYMIAKAAESDGLRQRLAEAHADARAAWDCCELRRKEAEAGQTRIADLEARLAEAEDQASETRAFIALFGAKPAEVVGRLERERDEARSSLETAVEAVRVARNEIAAAAVKEAGLGDETTRGYMRVTAAIAVVTACSRIRAALTPDAGTARSDEEGE